MDRLRDQQVPYCNSKVSCHWPKKEEEKKLGSNSSNKCRHLASSLICFLVSVLFCNTCIGSDLISCLSSCCCQDSFLPQGPFKFHPIIKDQQLNKVPATIQTVLLVTAPCYNLLIYIRRMKRRRVPLHGFGSVFVCTWAAAAKSRIPASSEGRNTLICVSPLCCRSHTEIRATRGQQMTERENSLSPTWLWTPKVGRGQREKLISRLLNI